MGMRFAWVLLPCLAGCAMLLDEPDTGGANNAADDVDASPNDLTALRVFATGGTWAGDLANDNVDGREAADQWCQMAAADGNLDGTFVAWISDDNDRAIDHVTGDGPWLLTGTGEEVFADRAQLTDRPSIPIDRSELGAQLAPSYVWTGTKNNGEPDGTPCNHWRERSNSGIAGWTDDTSQWSDRADLQCDEQARLYCFELP